MNRTNYVGICKWCYKFIIQHLVAQLAPFLRGADPLGEESNFIRRGGFSSLLTKDQWRVIIKSA